VDGVKVVMVGLQSSQNRMSQRGEDPNLVLVRRFVALKFEPPLLRYA